MSTSTSGIRFRALPSTAKSASTDKDQSTNVTNVRFCSHKKSPLPAGSYEAKFTQTIESPSGFTGPSAPFRTDKNFTIEGPSFKIDPIVDVDSVFPAPGHSEHANSLPHMVLTDPVLPWERRLSSSANPDSFNVTPWMALLAFSENELSISKKELSNILGSHPSETSPFAKQNPTGGFELTARDLLDLGNKGVPSALKPRSKGPAMMPSSAQETDPLTALFIGTDVFKALFSSYAPGAKTPQWNGTPDLKRYGYCAHIQNIHSHHMSSTQPGDGPTKDYSIIFSHRVGVVAPTEPTNVVVHLVSLDNVDQIGLDSDKVSQRVGLISLHSWSWMAIPEDHIDFVDAMARIASKDSIQPLRMKDRFLADYAKSALPVKTASTQCLLQRLQEGYVLRRHTDEGGVINSSFIRGPLCAQLPPAHKVTPSSTDGSSLEIVDALTGLKDVTYSSAWQLGRLLAIGDKNFTKCLLNIRGVIHSEAVKRTKEDKDRTFLARAKYLKQLPTAMDGIVDGNNSPAELTSAQANALYRWYEGPGTPGWNNNVAPTNMTLRRVCCSPDYLMYVGKVATDLTAALPSRGTTDSAIYNETNDPFSHSWAAVLSWILDILYTGRLPLHNLVPDPEALPSESVRTFFVDQIWLECVVDGALSLASHLEPDDDAIKKEVKRRVNQYLASTLGEGAQAQKPRLPRWGFFIRSAVVSAFPDLRIEIPTKEKSSNSDVLLMQRVGEDVLMVLSDSIPGEATFSNVVLSRPGHQNGFALGDGATGLTKTELTLTFQRLPTMPDSFNYENYVADGSVQQTWRLDSSRGEKPVFDWHNRTLILPEFAQQCAVSAGQSADSSKYFAWKPTNQQSVPSSLVATQLRKKSVRLVIASKNQAKLQELLADIKRNPWLTENGMRKIMIGDEPVAGCVSMQMVAFEEPSVVDPNLAMAKLPVLHRPIVAPPLAADGALTTTKESFSSFPDYRDDDERGSAYRYDKTNDLRVQFNLFPLHLRQESQAGIKGYSGVPLDFVFQLEGNNSEYPWEYFPHEIEILIPVRVSSIPAEQDASNRNLPVLFDIAGDSENPDLPTVEPVNVGPRWLYDVRVCYAYRIAQLGYWGTPQFEKQKEFLVSNLIIRIRSAAKWPKGTKNWRRPINANFLLKGVRVFVDRDNPDAARDVRISVIARNSMDTFFHKHVGFDQSFKSFIKFIVSPFVVPPLGKAYCIEVGSNELLFTSQNKEVFAYGDSVRDFLDSDMSDPIVNIATADMGVSRGR